MRIGSGTSDNAPAADAPAPRGKTAAADAALSEAARVAPARSGALAPLNVRRSASATEAPQPDWAAKGKRALGSSAEATPVPAAKRLRPAGTAPAPVTAPGAKTAKREPPGEAANASARGAGQSAQSLARPPKGSRQNTTAGMVYDMLLERSRGGSTSVIARAVSVPDGTVGRWINAKRWQSGELQRALANMQGYEQHRDAIDKLAKAMRLTTEDLPPPAAKQRAQVTAPLLKEALQLMLAKQGEGLAGRGRTPGVLSAVAGTLQIERRTLGAWLNPDGSPAKPLDAFERLQGFEQVRGELQALFARHGHQEVADSLHVPGDGATHKMTTALLVDILQKIKTDGAGSSGKIAGALGLQSSLVRKYVSPEDATLRAPDLVRMMPDYPQHREALAAALSAHGHDEQARALPLPFVDAERLLNTLRDDMPRFIDAIKAMRSDATLTPRNAAEQAGLLPEAVTAVMDVGGALRGRDEVYDTLSRLGNHLVPGLDEELARLRSVALGKAPVAAAPREMARFELPARGTIPAKVFIVRPSTGDPGPKAKNRLEKIYANNADLVSLPRSYAMERPRQMLRWLSTVLKARFADAREIQCYFHAASQQIVVASNTNEANAALEKFFAEGGAQALAEHAGAPLGAREARHAGKLRRSLAREGNSVAGSGDALQEQVRAAIAAGRFHVPRDSFNEHGSQVRLHAERRILHYVRTTFRELLDRRLLAGTMRPCGTCADELELDENERRGPFWMSQSAQALTDTRRIIERNIEKSIGTYVTKTREGRVTTDYDTDSGSDIEDSKGKVARNRR